MDNNINPLILDKLTKVCLCKSITRATIKDKIRNGALTVEKVAQSTGATTGSCHGCRCLQKISDLIDGYVNNEWS